MVLSQYTSDCTHPGHIDANTSFPTHRSLFSLYVKRLSNMFCGVVKWSLRRDASLITHNHLNEVRRVPLPEPGKPGCHLFYVIHPGFPDL